MLNADDILVEAIFEHEPIPYPRLVSSPQHASLFTTIKAEPYIRVPCIYWNPCLPGDEDAIDVGEHGLQGAAPDCVPVNDLFQLVILLVPPPLV